MTSDTSSPVKPSRFLVTASYDNSDGKFSFDDEIGMTIEHCGGEIEDSGQCLQSGRQEITGVFPSRLGAETAIKSLEGLGIEASLSEDGEDDGRVSTLLAIEFDPEEGWMPREIVSLLTFDLCSGWGHVHGPECDAILVECRSVAAAEYLKWKIDTGPLDPWVSAFFCPEEESQPVPSPN